MSEFNELEAAMDEVVSDLNITNMACVGIKNHPLLTPRNAARSAIESHGDPFVRDVQTFSRCLVGVRQVRPVVHRAPDFDLARLWPASVTLRQAG